MYTLGSHLANAQVFSLQSGHAIAKVSGQIIEPSTLELAAFYVNSPKSPQTVVLARDIRRLTPDTVVVDSSEDLEDPAEIVRLQELIQRKFSLQGIKVVSESGQKLGKVGDYTVSLSTYKVQKIYVKPSLMKAFLANSLIIDRAQIVDVTNQKITVRDGTVSARGMASIKALPTD